MMWHRFIWANKSLMSTWASTLVIPINLIKPDLFHIRWMFIYLGHSVPWLTCAKFRPVIVLYVSISAERFSTGRAMCSVTSHRLGAIQSANVSKHLLPCLKNLSIVACDVTSNTSSFKCNFRSGIEFSKGWYNILSLFYMCTSDIKVSLIHYRYIYLRHCNTFQSVK